MKNNVPSKAQVRGWKISTPRVTDTVHYDVAPKPVLDGTRADTATLRHGYTLDDLNRIARTVVVANAQWWRGADRHQQANLAFSAIAEHLYMADHQPDERELHAAGTRALVEDAKAYRHHHGLRDGGNGLTGEAPRFAAFWYEPPSDPWEDRLLDRIAVEQIMPMLDEPLMQAVAALAALEDYALAADALELKYPTLTARINRGRKQFCRYWYAPETAPVGRGTDRRVGSRNAVERTHCSEGHAFTPENTYWRPNHKGPKYPPSRYCRICMTAKRAENKRKGAARALEVQVMA